MKTTPGRASSVEISGPGACDVSIVISTRNRSQSLARTIQSAIGQHAPGVCFEVIAVDNNSSDDTSAVIHSFLGPDSPVRYVFEPLTGVSHGRNAGIAAARSPIVAFTDDDVQVSRDWVAVIKRTFDQRPDVDCIGGKIQGRWEHAPPRWLTDRHWSPVAIVDYGERPIEIGAQYPICLLTANMAVRRDVFDRVGGFSPEFARCQDHELQIRYWRAGGRSLYIPELIVTTDVPAERMTKPYHRAWHRWHGEYGAMMRLSETIGADGALLAQPREGSARILGVPSYLYRELLEEVAAWLRSMLRLRASEAFAHGNQLRYLTAYLRKRFAITTRDNARVPDTGMPRRRRWVVNGVVAFLIGGHLYDIVLDREHWPFSQYPMFSAVDENTTHRTLRLFGIAGETEIPLLQAAYIQPLDQCRLSTALTRISRRDSSRADLRHALDDVWTRYEERRMDGAHDGPPLSGVRLYELEWTLDADAANVERPQRREQLMEVSGR